MLVNDSLVRISEKVNNALDHEGYSKNQTKLFMHKELKREEIKIKLLQQLLIAHARYDDIYFRSDGTRMDSQSETILSDRDNSNGGQDDRRNSKNSRLSGGGAQQESNGNLIQNASHRHSNKTKQSDGHSSQPE